MYQGTTIKRHSLLFPGGGVEVSLWLPQQVKRPMGHIAHLRKQFEWINTYDYMITLIKRRKKPLQSWWELNGSSLNKIKSHSPKDALCQVWLKLAQWFWRRRFLNFVNVFLLFRNYLPLEKGWALLMNKLDSFHPRMLCAKFGWNWLSGSGEDFLNFVNLLSLFLNYLPLEKGRAHHLNKLESPSPKNALCQVWLKLAQWFLSRSRK